MVVVDASVAVALCAVEGGFAELEDPDRIAPPLMWSEARSALHLERWRGSVSAANAARTLDRLEDAPIARQEPARLGHEAWRIADELGWARTYDAEYLALARLRSCRVVTLDARMLRGAARTGLVVALGEL